MPIDPFKKALKELRGRQEDMSDLPTEEYLKLKEDDENKAAFEQMKKDFKEDQIRRNKNK